MIDLVQRLLATLSAVADALDAGWDRTAALIAQSRLSSCSG